MLTRCFVPVFFISLQCVTAKYFEDITLALANIPEDGRLDLCGLMNKYNYPCVKYKVTTKDGYILDLSRIPGNSSKPVFLQHGFVDSAMTWTLRGHNSLAAWLSNNTYDVWLGNTRGNMYSRNHTTLNPEHSEFWDFSFHEMALYDVPAMIDFILEETGQTKLQVIAHSQGTTLMFVLGSLNPEYCSRIKIVVCLAPIAYLSNAQQPLFPLLSLIPLLSPAAGLIAHGEFLRNSSELVALFRTACTQGLVGYAACGLGLSSVLFGSDSEQFEPEFAPVAFAHYPSGTSTKDGVHLGQIVVSGEFQLFDYGILNLAKYGSVHPPKYDLSKVPFNVSLYVSENDRLSSVKDVERLSEELAHVVQCYYMNKKINHIDYVWGKDMRDYLFTPVLETLINFY